MNVDRIVSTLESRGKASVVSSDFTWHHHQDTGRMQLIPRDIHKITGHVGGDSRLHVNTGGGGKRTRWMDEKYIYEWDRQHGKIEKYTKNGRKHLGEFDPDTGQQTKPADPTRSVEK